MRRDGGGERVDPDELDRLSVRAGFLSRNDRAGDHQFTCDPVAEYLTARRLSLDARAHKGLRADVIADPKSKIALALRAIDGP